MLNESAIITFLRNQFSSTHQTTQMMGIGDDAAVFPFTEDQSYVITTDSLNEDIHFRLGYFSPTDLAIKALQVNLSDIAAMGAQGAFALLTLALPRQLDPKWLNDFLTTFCQSCQQQGVVLIGGDTTASADKLLISVTLIGHAKQKHLKFRHTAKATDKICLIGSVGLAHLGFLTLEAHILTAKRYQDAFLRPQAKTQEGLWLGTQSAVNSLMDISDGLFIDLTRLCAASKVGAILEVDNLIDDLATIEMCQQLQIDPIECALTGGEDYALLCTINAENFPEIAAAFVKKFGYEIKAIGEITVGNKVMLKLDNQDYPSPVQVFTHFGEQ